MPGEALREGQMRAVSRGIVMGNGIMRINKRLVPNIAAPLPTLGLDASALMQPVIDFKVS